VLAAHLLARSKWGIRSAPNGEIAFLTGGKKKRGDCARRQFRVARGQVWGRKESLCAEKNPKERKETEQTRRNAKKQNLSRETKKDK